MRAIHSDANMAFVVNGIIDTMPPIANRLP